MRRRHLKLSTAAGLALCLASLVLGSTEANAGFVFQIGSASDELNFTNAKSVTTFTGTVLGFNVNFTASDEVDVASGNATVKPSGTTFTTLTAVPVSGADFTDFSTRGQLQAAGSVTLTVIDQNNNSFSHTFTGLPANTDFSALEVIAVAGSGETIKSVEISSSGFKELKQEAFGFGTAAAVPEPGTLTMAAVPASLLVLAFLRRRYSR
jgi:hypothetical protein